MACCSEQKMIDIVEYKRMVISLLGVVEIYAGKKNWKL